MPRFVTLKRVAQEADVSVYSASRALNGLDGVSDATRDKVLSVANQLGYVPNRAARSLRGEGTKTLGILTANSTNIYYARLVAGIEDATRPLGYHSLATDAMDAGIYSERREAEFVEAMLGLRVSAIVLTYRIRTENLERILDRRIPVVFVDCTPPVEFPDLPAAMSDGEAISLEAGRHLAGHGYRKWAYLGHNKGWPTRVGRERGIVAAADEAGVEIDVVEGSNSIQFAHRAMADYLVTESGRAMEALYVSNELLLVGSVIALRERGIRIGEDVGVIGFDDFDWAPACDVPFTVVDQRPRDIGRYAGSLILSEAGEGESTPASVMPEPTLIVRESCGCQDHTRPLVQVQMKGM